jgi:hypothetical protein
LAHYFFDITDGQTYADDTGMEFATIEAVRAHAISLSATLLGSHRPAFWRGEEWLIEVKDDIGVVLFTLAFRATETPVTPRQASKSG